MDENARVERAMTAMYAKRYAEDSRRTLADTLGVDDPGIIAAYAALLGKYDPMGDTPGIVYLDMENSESEQVFYAVLDSLTAGTVIESGSLDASEDDAE